MKVNVGSMKACKYIHFTACNAVMHKHISINIAWTNLQLGCELREEFCEK